MAAVVRLLDDPSGPRLVTITGPGGTGKTRLALRAAEQLGDRFSGGSCFVPLDAVQDPALVPAVVAHALGLPADGTAPATSACASTCARGRRSWCWTTWSTSWRSPPSWPRS